MPISSIDTSALLDAWVKHYPPDVFPAVWAGLDKLIDEGLLIASEEVLVELESKNDDIFDWAKEREDTLFVASDEDVQKAVASILASHPRLVDSRKGRSGADPWVIAVAMAYDDCIVVTAERPTGKVDRPNIPDVCQVLNIRCHTLIDIIRMHRLRF